MWCDDDDDGDDDGDDDDDADGERDMKRAAVTCGTRRAARSR